MQSLADVIREALKLCGKEDGSSWGFMEVPPDPLPDGRPCRIFRFWVALARGLRWSDMLTVPVAECDDAGFPARLAAFASEVLAGAMCEVGSSLPPTVAAVVAAEANTEPVLPSEPMRHPAESPREARQEVRVADPVTPPRRPGKRGT